MNEEKLLREFIAALEMLCDIHVADDEVLDCDVISAYGFQTYSAKEKLVELKLRLWSLLT